MTADEIKEVERLVNDAIFASYDVHTDEMSIDEARNRGAMALFGEKYGEVVRVVDMGGYSIELCGGAHLKNTAQVGSFKILSENGVAAGVRRIEAVTGKEALKHYQAQEDEIKEICRLVKSTPDKLLSRLEQLLAEQKETAKELEKLKAKMAGGAADEMLSGKVEIGGVAVLAAEVKDMDGNALRTMGDQLKLKLGSGVVVLASGKDGKVNLMAMATDDVVKKGVHAGNIIKAARLYAAVAAAVVPTWHRQAVKTLPRSQMLWKKPKRLWQNSWADWLKTLSHKQNQAENLWKRRFSAFFVYPLRDFCIRLPMVK